ncbi:MAG: hypothetical protein MJ137_03850 [Clostridia bacterium]|nr:hypothetical protein [Clostridia bacterium]
MKKTLAILLSALMVLSLAALGVSAADPVEISTAEQFAAMAPDGNYKLTADIKVSDTYDKAFTGTFDGNGHTITVSAPLFAEFNGTVTKLCVRGAVSGEGNIAPFAIVSAGMKATELYNAATVTSTNTEIVGSYVTSNYAAGIVAYVKGASTFTNCVNEAAISGNIHCGGLVGYSENVSVTFTGCVNNGTIAVPSGVKGRCGGIMALGGSTAADFKDAEFTVTFTNCVNNAPVTGGDQVGGLLGWTMFNVICNGCVNNGAVESTTNYAGGLVSRPGNDAARIDGPASEFINCINTGDVTSFQSQAAGMCSYVCTSLVVKNCINTGKISAGIAGEKNATVGGLVGKAAVGAGNQTVVIENSVNTGVVESRQHAAGIVGSVGAKDSKPAIPFTVKNCLNTGNVIANTGYAGGLVGYEYGWGGGGQYMDLEDSVNTGNVTAATFASEFMAYANDPTHIIKNNVGVGTLTGKYVCIWGVSSSNCAAAPNIEGNLIKDGDATTWFTYSEGTEGNRIAYSELTEAQVKRVDSVDASKLKTSNSDALASAAKKAVADAKTQLDFAVTVMRGTSPFSSDAPATGDNAVIIAVVAAVAVLGMGVALKARKA